MPSKFVEFVPPAHRHGNCTAAREMGRPIPEPGAVDTYSGKWVQRLRKSLHAARVTTAKREGVSLNQFMSTLLAEGLGVSFESGRI